MIQEPLFSVPDVYTFEVKKGYAWVVFSGYVYAKCIECSKAFPLSLYQVGDVVAGHDRCPVCRGEGAIRNRKSWQFPIRGARRIALTNATLSCCHCGTETQVQLRHMTGTDTIRNQPRCGKCRHEKG